MNYFCTLSDMGYMQRTLGLYVSMMAHCKPCKLYMLALNEETYDYLSEQAYEDMVVVPMSHFETDRLRNVKHTRTWVEYVWTCVADWITFTLTGFDIPHVNYIDGDCYFFHEPSTLYEEVGDADIGITPHRFSPHLASKVANGVHNGGFMYAKNSPTALKYLGEWADKSIEWCYHAQGGKPDQFGNQKYLDVWPLKEGVHVIEHKGVNLAPWNQVQYKYSVRDGVTYVEDDPVVFYHFHKGLYVKYRISNFVFVRLYNDYMGTMLKLENFMGEQGVNSDYLQAVPRK